MFSPLVFSKERRLNLMVIKFNIVYKNGIYLVPIQSEASNEECYNNTLNPSQLLTSQLGGIPFPSPGLLSSSSEMVSFIWHCISFSCQT